MDHWDEPTTLDEPTGPKPIERTGPAPLERTRHITSRMGLSVPGAIGGVLLIVAIAFGSNLDLTRATSGEDGAPPPAEALTDEPTEDVEPTKPDEEVKPTTKPDEEVEPTTKPDEEVEPTPKPEEKPDATPKPTPKPDRQPEPTPKPVMSLALDVREGAIFIDWGTCKVDGAHLYKVVRSYDSTVKWPAGEGDEVVAVVEVGDATKAWDEDAKPGKKAWYGVFCVRKTEAGYKVLSASAVKSIVAPKAEPEPTPKPEPTPAPEPGSMGLEVGVDGGAAVLNWESCGRDGFSHYRILRKVEGEAMLLAEIESEGTMTFVDATVDAGGTYRYAVQAKGQLEGEWVLLCTTEWVGVTVE